jgi:hypothetical protein
MAPIVEGLRLAGRVDVKAMAYRQTQEIWSRRSIAFDPLNETTSVNQAQNLLMKYAVKLVLTGTSVNSVDLEKRFIFASRREGALSLAVLDFWSNYRVRFSDENGNLAFVPDKIAVMDERARREMIQEGFKEDSLVITGQPALEDLEKWRDRFTTRRREGIRKKLGLKQEDVMVLFASQPLAGSGPAEDQDPNYRGYTEKTVLPLLDTALKRIRENLQQRILLVIQLHPREDPAKFKDLKLDGVEWKMSVPEEPYDLALSADLVSGMNSIFLMEAASLGCLTVSLQPGLRVVDKLPSNLNGMTIPVYHQKELEPIVEQLIVHGRPLEGKRYGVSEAKGSIKRVIALAYEMMGLFEEENEKRMPHDG